MTDTSDMLKRIEKITVGGRIRLLDFLSVVSGADLPHIVQQLLDTEGAFGNEYWQRICEQANLANGAEVFLDSHDWWVESGKWCLPTKSSVRKG